MLGGGCSGHKVDMMFTKWPKDDEFDLTFTQDGIEFLVDKKSAALLEGATLDHGGGLLDRGFKWIFPKATGGCGCGTSFSF
jgi:iron-sulfur cluster assembly protein